MLWSMYWLNSLDRNAIALARLNDLEEDLGLSSTRKSNFTEFLRRAKLTLMPSRVPNLCQHSLCGVPSWPNSKQYVLDAHTPKPIHGLCDDVMGSC